MRCLLLVLFAGLLFGQDYGQNLAQLASNIQEKKISGENLAELVANPEMSKTPTWYRSMIYSQLAYVYLIEKNKEAALIAFQKAVSLGFDDYLTVQESEWKTIHQDKRFQNLYNKMRISQADQAELFWLKQEVLHINNDTSLMITENMGRKDDAYTEIPQSQCPVRMTQSPAVIAYRHVIKYCQEYQKTMVMSSDISRKQHLTSMAIIKNMSGPENYDAYSSMIEREAKLQSLRQAQLRATQRRQDIAARRFQLPAGCSLLPVSCPPINDSETIQINKSQEKQVSHNTDKSKPENKKTSTLAEHNKDETYNPLNNAKTGDEITYHLTQQAGDQQGQAKVHYRFLTTGGGFAAYQMTSGENTQVETVEIKPTLKEQILYDLERQGQVELLSYFVEKGGYRYDGKFPDAHVVTLEFYWTLNGTKMMWTAVYSVSTSVPGFGFYGVNLTNAQFSFCYTLESFQRTENTKEPSESQFSPRPENNQE